MVNTSTRLADEIQSTEEAKAIAEVLKEADRDTLAAALTLAGPETQGKLIKALALSELLILSKEGEQTR